MISFSRMRSASRSHFFSKPGRDISKSQIGGGKIIPEDADASPLSQYEHELPKCDVVHLTVESCGTPDFLMKIENDRNTSPNS